MSGETEARSRPERLMNLLIMLLVQDRFVSKETIRTTLYDEPAGPAFDRMFDRDKELLRALGVPIQTGHQDVWFEDEPGYRISPDEYALPGIRFAADEAAVVSLAAKVWQHAALADTTASALRKLSPLMDQEPETVRSVPLPALESAALTAEEPSFEAFWTATQERRRITFDYRTPRQLDTSRRRLEPWGVVRHSGRWYVVGHDVDRREERIFRLSRVAGKPSLGKEPNAYEVPDGTDLPALTRRLAPAPAEVEATVLVRQGKAWGLRRHGEVLHENVPGPDATTSWDRLRLRSRFSALSDQVLASSPDVVVEGPEELRDEVVGRLDQFLLVSTGTGESA